MRRTLELTKIPEIGRIVLSDIGNRYLKAVRAIDPKAKALALATYEDGGLEESSGNPHSSEMERSAAGGIQAFSSRAHQV